MKILGEIPRIHRPDLEEFTQRYLLTGRPVVITGGMEGWEALRKWTIRYLSEHCGDNEVPVRRLSPGGGTHVTRMRLRDYLEQLLGSAEASQHGSIGEVPLRQVLWQVEQDLGPSPYRHNPVGDLAVMIGRRTYAPLHFHGSTDAISSQVIGTKRFVLFDPEQPASLYPHAWYDPNSYNFSTLNLDDGHPVDTSKFPDFERLVGLECTLHAGESLFIPVHWWHTVYGSDDFNILLVDFFDAPVSRWKFPFPGVRSLVQRTVERATPRRLVDWYTSHV
jgi:hypothetical protein